MKKSICLILSVIMLLSILAVAPVTAGAMQEEPKGDPEGNIVSSETAASEAAASEDAASEDAASESTGSEASTSEAASTEPVDTSIVVFDPGTAADDDFVWLAWTWSDDKDAGTMVKGAKIGSNYIFRGLSEKVTFGMVYSDTENPTWNDKEDYTTIDYDVTGNKFVITGWSENDEAVCDVWGYDYYVGTWSNIEITDDMITADNTLKVSASTKTLRTYNLKKAAATVKPITISKAKGAVKAELVKDGTTSAIYGSVTVNASTGAVTLKKGSYKEGTYKIVISVTAAGNETYKAKTIKKTATIVIKGKNANTVTAKTSTKTLKLYYMKKAKKSVKPIKVSKAKGSVKIVKVKKGTSSKIYKKISVSSKTGAITFKKGSYKKGSYKVKLKISAKGNEQYKSKSFYKTVKIVIKDRKSNTFYVNAYDESVLTSSLKKSKQTIQPFYIHDNKGKVKAYKLKKGTSKKIYKKFSVSNSGKVTLKKGKYKVGTYKIRVKFKAKGNGEYKPKTVTKTITLTIKKSYSTTTSTTTTNTTTTSSSILCPSCHGTGFTTQTIWKTQVISYFPYQTMMVPSSLQLPCSTCHGSGRI